MQSPYSGFSSSLLSWLLLSGAFPSEAVSVINYLYLESIVARMPIPQGHCMLVWTWHFCETLCCMRRTAVMNLPTVVMEGWRRSHKAA